MVEFSIIVSWALTAVTCVFRSVVTAFLAAVVFVVAEASAAAKPAVSSPATSEALNFLVPFATGTPASIAALIAAFCFSSDAPAAPMSVSALVIASSWALMLSASVPFRATLSLLAPSLKALTAAARSFSFSAFSFVASAIFLASLPAFLGSRFSLYDFNSSPASFATPLLLDALFWKSAKLSLAVSISLLAVSTAPAFVFTVAIAVSAVVAASAAAVVTVPMSVVLSLSTSAALNFLPAFSTGTPASIAFLSAAFLASLSLPVATVVRSPFAAVTASACFAMLVASVPFRVTLSLSAPVCKALTAVASSFSFSAFTFSFAATSFFRALLSAS